MTSKLAGYLDNIAELSKQLGAQKELHAKHTNELREKSDLVEEMRGLIGSMEKQIAELEDANESRLLTNRILSEERTVLK